MITINGQKMGKSLGNSIMLEEFFTGNHKLLDKAYSPMTIRFFILQAHYRSPLDFSNEALLATEKGLDRLKEGIKNLNKIIPSEKSTIDPDKIENNFYEAMNDDLNSPVAISYLFDGIREINSVIAGHDSLTASDTEKLKKIYRSFVYDVLGLHEESQTSENKELLKNLIDLLLKMRMEARNNKDFKTSDRIRNELEKFGVEIHDTKDGFEWKI
jgi:cysteinyl-tRNA synthetase